MNPFDLTGRKALVTGSFRGIGAAIAKAFRAAGADVTTHSLNPHAGVDITADIGSEEGIAALAPLAAETDILVLNASAQSYATPEQFTDELYERMFECNVRSAFRLIKIFAPAMASRGHGRIIALGSVNQARPAGRLAIYAATKAAQQNLMTTCAKEYAARGVTFNTILPGIIATDRNAKVLSDPEFAAKALATIPMGRFGTAEDCAGAAVFLASDAASYVTGAIIDISGGFSL